MIGDLYRSIRCSRLIRGLISGLEAELATQIGNRPVVVEEPSTHPSGGTACLGRDE